MYIVLFIILLVIIFAYLLFTKPVKVSFLLDSEKMYMHVLMTWLPLLRVEAKTINLRPRVSVYLFGKKVSSGFMRKRKTSGSDLIRALSLENTRIKTYYGLSEPHFTGILFGALNFVSSVVESYALEQYPEFVPAEEYLRVEAESDLNAGRTIVNLMKLRKSRRRKNYGSVGFN